MKQSLVLSSLLALILFSQCGKKDSSLSKTDLITSASWKYDNAGIDLNADGQSDSGLPPGFVETCETDNIITFKSDGTGTIDEGLTKCDIADPQTSSFTWSFKENETVINIPTAIITGFDGDAKIVKLTASEFDLSKTVTVGVTTVTVILELKH